MQVYRVVNMFLVVVILAIYPEAVINKCTCLTSAQQQHLFHVAFAVVSLSMAYSLSVVIDSALSLRETIIQSLLFVRQCSRVSTASLLYPSHRHAVRGNEKSDKV